MFFLCTIYSLLIHSNWFVRHWVLYNRVSLYFTCGIRHFKGGLTARSQVKGCQAFSPFNSAGILEQSIGLGTELVYGSRTGPLEPVFVNLLRSPGIDSKPGEPISGLHKHLQTLALHGYIGWRYRFLGIDSWAPWKLKNAVSDKKWLMGLEVDFNAMLYVFIPF